MNPKWDIPPAHLFKALNIFAKPVESRIATLDLHSPQDVSEDKHRTWAFFLDE